MNKRIAVRQQVGFLAAVALMGCAGSTGSQRGAGTLSITRPDPTETPASIAPVDSAPFPIRAFARNGGVLLAIDHTTQVSVHDRHLCVLDDAGAIWCLRTEGIATRGTIDTAALARQFTRITLTRPAREVVAGSTHACAIDIDHNAFCWGTNDQGELGNGSSVTSLEPVRVTGLEDVAQISAGERFTCARTLAGAAYCWGHNANGQLGDGSRISRSRPVRVLALPPVADLAAGQRHACARTHDGTPYCWGDNAHRQLGCSGGTEPSCTDPAQSEARPVRVPDVSDVMHFALGDMHSCARLRNESVQCWGERANGAGQTGYGLIGWPEEWFADQISAGANATCAVMDSSSVRCWGDFAFDPFERGENGRTSYPLPEIRGVQNAAVGDRITCLRFGDGAARCWLR